MPVKTMQISEDADYASIKDFVNIYNLIVYS